MKNLTVEQRITACRKAKEAKDKVFTEKMIWCLENLTPLETIHEIMGCGFTDDVKLSFFKEITFNRTIKFKNK